MDIKELVTVFMWAWIAVILIAYVYQFKGLMRPILNLLGLS